MLLHRGMSVIRSRMRLAAAATCVTLATTATLSACSTTEKLTTGLKVKSAFEKLGEQPSATVMASVDGTTKDAYTFLEKARGGSPSLKEARLLSRAELTLSVGSGDTETPLKEMKTSDAADMAAALNFGGRDVFGVKSVHDKLYLRVALQTLVAQTGGSAEARADAAETVALADDLPLSLHSARDALKGKWVRVDPDAFDDFARAAETLSERAKNREDAKKGKGKGEDTRRGTDRVVAEEGRRTSQGVKEATAVGSGLDGQSQREFLHGMEKTLAEHASFKAAGERGGAEIVRMTLPGRAAADDLSAALKPLGAQVDPDAIPDGDVTAELELRRGQLTGLTMDLGQLTGNGGKGEGAAHLPLRLEFGGGAAVFVDAPGGAKELKPQDLLAAIMYGALGRTGS
ncbi:hypothetical protein [Streptomyces daliensis]